ncbi:hypothetical protein EMCRGX_G023583 [Ephydatia muelleri]
MFRKTTEPKTCLGSAALATEERKHRANDASCHELGWLCVPLDTSHFHQGRAEEGQVMLEVSKPSHHLIGIWYPSGSRRNSKLTEGATDGQEAACRTGTEDMR